MRTSLLISVSLAALLSTPVLAENIVRFDNAAIQPGGSAVIDVTLETDVVLFGWNLVVRWTSPDLRCDSVRVARASFDSRYLIQQLPIDHVERIIRLGILPNFFGEPPTPTVPAGQHLAARLYFTALTSADDQYASVDLGIVSVTAGNETLIERSAYAAPNSITIFPTSTAGIISIGAPTSASIRATPNTLVMRVQSLGQLRDTETLMIEADGPGVLDWSASWNSEWLSVTQSSGTTPISIDVTADASFLSEGSYRDTITIESVQSDNLQVKIPVIFAVHGGDEPLPPRQIELEQNRPSPFVVARQGVTHIPFLTKVDVDVEISIHDVLGRRIRTLVRGPFPVGDFSVPWDGRDESGRTVASGVYLCRMSTGDDVQSRVIVLIK